MRKGGTIFKEFWRPNSVSYSWQKSKCNCGRNVHILTIMVEAMILCPEQGLGAKVMSSENSGAAAFTKKQQSHAEYIHCRSQAVNFALSFYCKNQSIQKFMDNLRKLRYLIDPPDGPLETINPAYYVFFSNIKKLLVVISCISSIPIGSTRAKKATSGVRRLKTTFCRSMGEHRERNLNLRQLKRVQD